mmetsp:Transcript_60772/g.112048  ORF Transcript_60772/g.112048 Transcript_60772/m.112048 type:complete len:304 (-) Transcript_60772:33-944(-)
MCSAGPHGHAGAHDCLTDHRCHRTFFAGAHGSLPCLREAGHFNSCLFQQLSLPVDISQRPHVSRADVFAPLTALIPVEAPLQSSADHATCAICLDSLGSGGSCVALPCAHCFHRICTVEWLVRKPFCPLCRFRVVGNGDTPSPMTVFAYSQVTDIDSPTLSASLRANARRRERNRRVSTQALQDGRQSSDQEQSALPVVDEQLASASLEGALQNGGNLDSAADASSSSNVEGAAQPSEHPSDAAQVVAEAVTTSTVGGGGGGASSSRRQSARTRARSSTTSLGFRPSAVAPRNSSFSRRRPPV